MRSTPNHPQRPSILRRRLAPLAGVAVLASTTAALAAPPIDVWARDWTPSIGTWALADLVAVDGAGSLWVSARGEDGAGTGNSSTMLTYDPDGTLASTFVLGSDVSGSQGFTDLVVTDTGLAAVGTTLTSEGPRTVLVDFASDGTVRWQRMVLGPAFAGIFAPQVALGPAGRRVIATDDGSGTGVIAWYEADGTPVAEVPLSFTGFGGVSALEVDAQGDALLVSVSDFNRYDVQSIAPDGTIAWTHTETASSLILSEAFVGLMPGGDLVVSGTFEEIKAGQGGVRVRAWRLTPDGELVWRRTLADSPQDFRVMIDLAVDPAGDVLLATNRSIGSPSELIRLDAAGDTVWTRASTAPEFTSTFTDVAVDAFGAVLVTGADLGLIEDRGARVVRFAANGDLLWTDRVFGPEAGPEGSLRISDLATGPGGGVALVGTTRPDGGLDRATTIRLDFAACGGDLDDDGGVDLDDLLTVLAAWGSSAPSPADLDGDGSVGLGDLITVLAAWGPCPAAG